MTFRVVTLNIEQDHKRWDLRRALLADQLCALKPDILALNEVCVPLQTARWLQSVLNERLGTDYALVQQNRTGGLSAVEAKPCSRAFPYVKRRTSISARATWWRSSLASSSMVNRSMCT
jgi:mRNA deadenylase 3'-5' endonuclease subunit Ccr4